MHRNSGDLHPSSPLISPFRSSRRSILVTTAPHARPTAPPRSAKPTDPTRTLSHGPAVRSAKPTHARPSAERTHEFSLYESISRCFSIPDVLYESKCDATRRGRRAGTGGDTILYSSPLCVPPRFTVMLFLQFLLGWFATTFFFLLLLLSASYAHVHVSVEVL